MPKLTLSFKGQSISVHRLEEGKTLVGRDPQCGIVIDSLAVALQHAEVNTEGDRCWVKSLDETNPVMVNNKPVTEARLNHGDLLQIGKHALTLAQDGHVMGVGENGEVEEKSKPAKKPKKGKGGDGAYLQILSGENIGRIIPLKRNMIRLGKAGGDCAVIAHRAGGYYLSHLEGAMPTVNGVPIGDESVMLTRGSQITIGATSLVFYT